MVTKRESLDQQHQAIFVTKKHTATFFFLQYKRLSPYYLRADILGTNVFNARHTHLKSETCRTQDIRPSGEVLA